MHLTFCRQNISIHIKSHKDVHVQKTTAADTILTRINIPTKQILSKSILGFFRPFCRGISKTV